jgi:hypothetical protein
MKPEIEQLRVRLQKHSCPIHQLYARFLFVPFVRSRAMELLEREQYQEGNINPWNVPEDLVDIYSDPRLRRVAEFLASPDFAVENLGVRIGDDKAQIVITRERVWAEENFLHDEYRDFEDLENIRIFIYFLQNDTHPDYSEMNIAPCPVTSEDTRTLFQISYRWSSCIFTQKDAERILQGFQCGILLPSNIVINYVEGREPLLFKKSEPEEVLASITLDEWWEFRKKGQKFLFAHISRFLRKFYDTPDVRAKFEDTIQDFHEFMYHFIFCKENQDFDYDGGFKDFLWRVTWFYFKGNDTIAGDNLIAYISQFSWDEADRIETLFEQFLKNDHTWGDFAAKALWENFEPDIARSISQWWFFSVTGSGDPDHQRSIGLRDEAGISESIHTPQKHAVVWSSVIQMIVPPIMIYIEENTPGLTDEEFRKQSIVISRKIIAVSMRQSSSRLNINAETVEKMGLCIITRDWMRQVGVNNQTIREITAQAEQDRAVGCPVQHTPDMWRELIDFMVTDLMKYRSRFAATMSLVK